MDVTPATHTIAALLGEASRSRMLENLMDGRARTAKELAFASAISPQTASSHLAKLVDASLLAIEVQGRHRYYRIAHPDVARTIEAMMTLAGRSALIPAPRPETALPPIKLARFCYDHLAGRLGVELLSTLRKHRYLVARDQDYDLTRSGDKFVSALGVEVASVRQLRRRFACSCLDWSERTPHLGGSLGAALAGQFLSSKWIRLGRESRVVLVTDQGRKALAAQLGLTLPTATAERRSG